MIRFFAKPRVFSWLLPALAVNVLAIYLANTLHWPSDIWIAVNAAGALTLPLVFLSLFSGMIASLNESSRS